MHAIIRKNILLTELIIILTELIPILKPKNIFKKRIPRCFRRAIDPRVLGSVKTALAVWAPNQHILY